MPIQDNSDKILKRIIKKDDRIKNIQMSDDGDWPDYDDFLLGSEINDDEKELVVDESNNNTTEVC